MKLRNADNDYALSQGGALAIRMQSSLVGIERAGTRFIARYGDKQRSAAYIEHLAKYRMAYKK